METVMRAYRDEDDFWRIRDFLREVFRLNDRRELSWQVYRFDLLPVECLFRKLRIEDVVFIWETADGRIAAVLNPEDTGDAFLQVHPGLRTKELEEEMLIVAEERLASPGQNGRRRLRVWTNELDTLRQGILTRRGYTKGDGPEHHRRRPMSMPIPDVLVAAGYTVRALGDVEELPARSLVSWKAFHPDRPDECYPLNWYQENQRAPLYRRDLDIVIVAPNGEFASFCTVWFDDVNRTGAFEPVGTAPEHQRRGLGKAVMCEGLRRLKRMGATMAYVGSFSPAAHALYSSVGLAEYDLSCPWLKEL